MTRIRFGALGNLTGRALCHDKSPFIAALGSKIDHVVANLDISPVNLFK